MAKSFTASLTGSCDFTLMTLRVGGPPVPRLWSEFKCSLLGEPLQVQPWHPVPNTTLVVFDALHNIYD